MPPFIKKGFGICATRKKFFQGASSPVIVQRVTKGAIKLKTRLPNGQLTQILKCHQQLPKRLEKCWRTKLLSESQLPSGLLCISAEFCLWSYVGITQERQQFFWIIEKETSKAINSGSLGGSYILHPILQYCLLHDPGNHTSENCKVFIVMKQRRLEFLKVLLLLQ